MMQTTARHESTRAQEPESRVPAVARLVLVFIGVAVLALWVAAVVSVIAFLVWVWPAPIGVGLALLFGVGLFVGRSRVGRLPEASVPILRHEAPELFGLIDAVSEELGAPRLEVLAFDEAINASTLRIGLRRQLALVIGMPLWEALDPPQRVALLGHEVAHAVNGDVRRSAVVGSAIDVVAHWHLFTDPGSLHSASKRGVAETLAWFLMAVPHVVLEGLVRLQIRLTLDNQRRAEFAADRLAASVAGTRACVGLLDRLLFVPSVELAVKRAVQSDDSATWPAIRRRLDELPADEKERIRSAAFEAAVTVDSSHPPTGHRIDALRADPFCGPHVWLDTTTNGRIDAEIESVRDELEPLVRSTYSHSERW